MQKKQTDQLNFSSTPIPLIERFENYLSNYRQIYKRRSASKSEVGATVLEVGLEVCEKVLEEKKIREKI